MPQNFPQQNKKITKISKSKSFRKTATNLILKVFLYPRMTNESEASDMPKSESEAVFDDDARPPSRKRSRKRKKSIYKPLGKK